MDNAQQMGEEKIGRLLLKFSIPSIIGMLVNGMHTIVDRVFVGRGVGDLALAGVAVTFPIVLAMMAFGMLIGFGATAVVSIRLGQQRKEDAEQVLGNAFVLLVAIGLMVTFFCYLFMDPLLALLGASPEVLPYAKQFLKVLLLGTVFLSVGFGLNSIIRAEGNPRIAMYTMILGAVINVILNPVFIFGLKMGVAGSALATVSAQFVTAVWVVYYFLSSHSLLKLRVQNFRLKWIAVKDTLAIGLSPFSMQMVGSFVTVFFNKSLSTHGGDPAIAAFAVITSITMLVFMPILGISQGAQPIMGYNFGAKSYDRVKETFKLAALGATGVVTVGFLLVQLFPTAIMSLFSAEAELILLGAEGMRLYLLMLPVIGFQFVAVGYFQATGQPRKSLFLSMCRQLIFLVPMIWLLPQFLGLYGIWLAAPVSDIFSAILTATLLRLDLIRLGKSEKAEVL